MIRRHSLSAVCMHWFNAFCWIALLFTGVALLSNPAMQPVGMWWADLWTGVFGAYGLLVFHLLIGSAWLAVYFLYLIFGLRHDVIPFLKEVFSLSPASDMTWCVRKGMRLVLGEKAMRSMGLDPALPPQGFYNAGQKLAAVAAVLCSVGLALSGLFLAALALHLVAPGSEDAAQWALFIHLLCAGVMALGTGIGGRRIINTVGRDMVSLSPGEGFAADLGGAACLLFCTLAGLPVSTTHAKTAAILGVGAASGGPVNRGVAGGSALTWLLTFPGCGALGFLLARLFHP